MTDFDATSTRSARRRARFSLRAAAIAAGFILGATAFGSLPAAQAESAGADGRSADAPPVIRQGTVPGVGVMVEVPKRMQHSLTATADEHGKVEMRGGQRGDDDASAPVAK